MQVAGAAQRRRPSGFQAAGRSQQASVATSAQRRLRRACSVDRRRPAVAPLPLARQPPQHSAAMGMVRALDPGEAMEMAVTRPVLVAPRRVSHTPPRRQPQCTSTKTTRTTVSRPPSTGHRAQRLDCACSCVVFARHVCGSRWAYRVTHVRDLGRSAMSPGSEGGVEHVLVRHHMSPWLVCCCYKITKKEIGFALHPRLPGGETFRIRVPNMNSINATEAGSARGGFAAPAPAAQSESDRQTHET